MVAVGSAVSVAGVKMGVMMIGSKAEQDAINNVVARAKENRSDIRNIMRV
jgi:hypothetical protein